MKVLALDQPRASLLADGRVKTAATDVRPNGPGRPDGHIGTGPPLHVDELVVIASTLETGGDPLPAEALPLGCALAIATPSSVSVCGVHVELGLGLLRLVLGPVRIQRLDLR